MRRNSVFRSESGVRPTLLALALVWPHSRRAANRTEAAAGDGRAEQRAQLHSMRAVVAPRTRASACTGAGAATARGLSLARVGIVPRRLPDELWRMVGLEFVLPLCLSS